MFQSVSYKNIKNMSMIELRGLLGDGLLGHVCLNVWARTAEGEVFRGVRPVRLECPEMRL